MKEDINPELLQSMLKLADVSILLSSYNNIFSSFDQSEYFERISSQLMNYKIKV